MRDGRIARPPAPAAAFLLALGLAGCGGSKGAAIPAPEASAEQHERRGLELAEARDFEGALAEFQAAQRKEPSADGVLSIAHLAFMLGRYEEAKSGYQSYLSKSPQASARERQQIAAEIRRIEKALEAGEEPQGKSLAGLWMFGRLARMRAEDHVAAGRHADAFAEFDKAYQYLGKPEMLFEAAMAATEAEDWGGAIAKYEEYLTVGGETIDSGRAYAVAAEIDRLTAIANGEEPVTWESLADQVRAERGGEKEPEAPPPSQVAEQAAAEQAAAEQAAAEKAAAEKAAAEKAAAEKAAAEKAAAEQAAAEQAAAEKAAAEQAAAEKAAAETGGYEEVDEESPAMDAALMPPGWDEEPKAEDVPVPRRAKATLEDLLFYTGSRSSSVRLRAVRDLIAVPDDRARQALEERMLEDRNMVVRFAAIEGLAARRSWPSLPALKRASITAATSQERAVIRKAIEEIRGDRR